MIEEGFFFFDNGAFGELVGFKKIKLSPEEEQKLLDINTREITYGAFDPPKGLSPEEYSGIFMETFLKARNKCKDEQESMTEQFTLNVQVGNSESLAEIHIIEKHPLFSHWQQPELVEKFKHFSIKYISQ